MNSTVWYQIAEYFSIPNERIEFIKAQGNTLWFKLGGTEYNCTLLKNGLLKKNSIRRSLY